MKILKIDRRENFLELLPENFDDLWHLTHVLEKGDMVSGKSTRSYKGKDEEENQDRKHVFIELEVESIELHKYSGKLRVLGIIVSGKPEEYVELKAHHSLDFGEGDKLKVKKKKLRDFQLKRLKKAQESVKRPKILVIVLDDEEATYAVLHDYGFEEKAKISAFKKGKRYDSKDSGKYFSELAKKIQDIGIKNVFIAGPGFTKDSFKNYLNEKVSGFEFSFDSINSVGVTGLNELLKKGIALKAIKESEIAKESMLVEQILIDIGKNSGFSATGIEETKKALNAGAVKDLLVSSSSLLEDKEKFESLMEEAEKLGAQIHVVSSEHEAGKKLIGLGSIAALLRFKLSY